MTDENHECYYCGGEGYGENRVDVDRWEKVCCDYCGGTGYYSRPAGMRDTSAPNHDPLRNIRQLRIGYVKEKRRYAEVVENQGELEPLALLKADQAFGMASFAYRDARKRAMRRIASIRTNESMVEMLSRSAAMAAQSDALVASIRSAFSDER